VKLSIETGLIRLQRLNIYSIVAHSVDAAVVLMNVQWATRIVAYIC